MINFSTEIQNYVAQGNMHILGENLTCPTTFMPGSWISASLGQHFSRQQDSAAQKTRLWALA